MPTVEKPENQKVQSTTRRLRAKVFWNGRSQAIRLPKEMRLTTDEVFVMRDGARLVIEPIEVERDSKGWPLVWWELAGAAPEFDVGERGTPHERGDVLSTERHP